MACHPDPALSAAQRREVAEIVTTILAGRNDHCSACGGLRLQVRNPCPHVGCPLREALHLEVA